MARRSRVLSILLLLLTTAGALVAFTLGSGAEAKATLGPLQAVTLSAADFHAAEDWAEFSNHGDYATAAGPLVARIPFPAETVVLTSVKIRVRDTVSDQYFPNDLCVRLHRALPGDASQEQWGEACTWGEVYEDPQTLSITAFKRVGKFHTAYLYAVFLFSDVDLRLYGATVFYRVVA